MKAPVIGGRRTALWLLLAPALVLTLVFFGIPALYMARMSFNGHQPQAFFVPGFTFENYSRLVTDPLIRNAIWNTLRLSVIASFLTIVISYVFAFIVWTKPPRWKLFFVAIALCPLLISEIAIIFGWWMVFPKNGLLSLVLYTSGLVTQKSSLMYTEGAAFVGLIYVTMPYSFFIFLSVFDEIDRQVLEAAADLGAPPLTTFRRILFPLTSTGILIASAQVFIWTMGAYATPMALGPDTLWTLGFLIQDQMLAKHHWPMAAALAMALAAGVAVVIVLLRWLQPEPRSHAG